MNDIFVMVFYLFISIRLTTFISAEQAYDRSKFDLCSRSKVIDLFNLTHMFHPVHRGKGVSNAHSIEKSLGLTMPGAVVTSYSGVMPREYKCQVESHQRYCDRFGYKCYTIEDNNWDRQDIPKYWSKIKSILSIMKMVPKHPWILYLDADSVVQDLPELSNRSVENFLRLNPNDDATYLYMPDNIKGWGTDIIFVKNNHQGFQFMEHFWMLQNVCPNCVGEQCAGHIAFFDALMYDVHTMINKGEIQLSDEVLVEKDRGRINCCSPRNHCEYPMGRNRPEGQQRNHGAGNQVQGCVWNWEVALKFKSTDPLSRRFAHISGENNMREHLGYLHPVKEGALCEKIVAANKENNAYVLPP